MEMPLPYRDFRWVDECENFDVFENQDPHIGHALEVDLHIPRELHDKFKDFPPLLTRENINGSEKLVGTLHDKTRYVIHERNLKFAIKHGVVLEKIHRVLRFRQKPFLKPYMQLNSKLRQRATSLFEKTLYKNLNNIIFGEFPRSESSQSDATFFSGKCLQNDRKHVNLTLATSWKKAKRLIAKPHFHRSVIIDENLVAIIMKKTSVTLQRPVYVGFAVLELAKLQMYTFHYEKVLPELKATLCYTGEC